VEHIRFARVVHLPAIFLTLLLGGCRWQNARGYVDKGNRLFAQGEIQEASLNYRKAIQKDPDFGEAYYQLGLASIRLEHSAAALQAFERAATLLPARKDVKVALANLCLATLLMGSGNSVDLRNRIAAISDQFLAEDPTSYDGLRLKAQLANTDRNFANAKRFFQRANEIKPMQPEIITGWMNALFQDGQLAEAEKLGLQLIAANKTYGPVYDQLYSYYIAANKVAEAEEILKSKVANNPSAPDPAFQLAAFYSDHGKPDEMKAILVRILDSPGTFPKGHLLVGDFYAGRRQWDESIRQYQAGAEANPQGKITYLKRIVDIWLAQEQPAKAAPIVAEILKADPADDSSKAVSASLAIARGKSDDIATAVAQFKALVEKSPDNAVWRYGYGKALASQGDVEGARNQQQEAIKRQRGFLLPYLALAELFQAQGDYRTALDYSNQSLAIDADSPPARLLHAISLMHTGRVADAGRELTALEKAYPQERKVQIQLALLDLKERRPGRAEERFRKLVRENPGDTSAMSGLLDVLAAKGRLDEAMPLLQEELDRSPESDGVRSLLADTALRIGAVDLALTQYQQLATSQPNQDRPYIGLGLAHRQKRDLPSAIASFQKACTLAPNDPAPIILLAQTLVSADRIPEAIRSYRRALELRPGNAAIMNDLAYEIADAGDNLDEALELAQGALKKNYRQPQFGDTVGWIYFKKHASDRAIPIFRNLITRYPDNPTFRYHLGMALLQKGDKVLARSEFKTALSKRPSPERRHDIEAGMQAAR
jgi:tetratricopeptide (TPR) repeat protein